MNKQLPNFLTTKNILIIFLLSLTVTVIFLFSRITNIAYAQLSGCGEIDVGNPGANVSIPPQCQGSGNYANPFPGGWTPNRLDMGYDGTFKGQIHAPFAGKIVYAATGVATWGGYLELQAPHQLPGLPSATLYFAEGISPLVKTGDSVTENEPIAQAVPNSLYNGIVGNIEFGVSDDGPGYVDTYCLGTLHCGHCPDWTTASKNMVHSFATWVKANLHVEGTPTLTLEPNGTSIDCSGSA